MAASRENAIASKTLVCLIQALKGQKTTVEFRDDSEVTGTIVNVDGYMTIEMRDVTYVSASGVRRDFDTYCAQGKFIRYVQIPSRVDPVSAIKGQLELLSRMKPTRGRGRGARGGRGGRGFSRGSSRPSYGGSSSRGSSRPSYYGGGSSRPSYPSYGSSYGAGGYGGSSYSRR